MHSRIFQVSESPIPQDKLSKQYRYEDGFVGSVADYVALIPYKSADYLGDLQWLQNVSKGIEVDIENGTIKVTNKKEYFDEKHDKFIDLLEELKNVTLDDFSKENFNLSFKISDLKYSYEDKYSFYVDDNDEYCGISNFDNWVRSVEENKTYYVGSIIDYHF